jgi:hypothetical protein
MSQKQAFGRGIFFERGDRSKLDRHLATSSIYDGVEGRGSERSD